ncbi:hypothetical protein [Streptomyces sp. NPDC090022]|uniref:hypothetical protein n=1 Tax=Streptomyces sp. NPDC090022 TaxID=3365920 RepID=UPI0037FEC592
MTPVTHPGGTGTGTGTGTGPGSGELAETGGGGALGVAVPLAGGMLLAGAVLYRRARGAHGDAV